MSESVEVPEFVELPEPEQPEVVAARVRVQVTPPWIRWLVVVIGLISVAATVAVVGLLLAYLDKVGDVDALRAEATCRAEINAEVEAARDDVEAIDGQTISTMGIAFGDALGGTIEGDRRAELQQLFRDQASARRALASILDDAHARAQQVDAICSEGG